LHKLAFCGIMLSNDSKGIANACYHLQRWAIMYGPLRKGQPMDIEEFEKRVQPSAKRSRLEPFRSQIFELKAKGYADWQVRDWLAANGLEISRQAVQQFFKKEAKAERVRSPCKYESAACTRCH
jgi:hypothetical protein